MAKLVTIANGASVSAAAKFDKYEVPSHVYLPSNIDSATSITFQVSYDGTNFFNLYNSAGVEVAPTAGVSRAIALDPNVFAAVKHLKVRLGTSGTPVVTTADRIIGIEFEE